MMFDKMHEYEMDPTRTVSATGLTPDAGQPDGLKTDGVKPVYPLNKFIVWGVKL